MRNKTKAIIALAAVAVSGGSLQAQVYQYGSKDLQLIFKRGGSSDLEVNLGQVDFFKSLPLYTEYTIDGGSRPNNSFTSGELNGIFGNANSLSFAVIGGQNAAGGATPVNTTWISRPSGAAIGNRFSATKSAQVRGAIDGIAGAGASTGALQQSAQIAAATASGLNTTDSVEVQAPSGDADSYTFKAPATGGLNSLLGGGGSYQENTTPGSFTTPSAGQEGSVVRSDLYEYLPASSNNGFPAQLLGFFSLYNDGTLSFTPVPEAGTTGAIIAGLVMLGAFVHRQRSVNVTISNLE